MRYALLLLFVLGCARDPSLIDLDARAADPVSEAVAADVLRQRWEAQHALELRGEAVAGKRAVLPQHPADYRPTWREQFDAIARQRGVGWREAGGRAVSFRGRPMDPGFTVEVGPPFVRTDAGRLTRLKVAGEALAIEIERFGDVSGLPDADAAAAMLDGEPATLGAHEAVYREQIDPATNAALRQWAVVVDGRRFLVTAAQRFPETADLPPIARIVLDSFEVTP